MTPEETLAYRKLLAERDAARRDATTNAIAAELRGRGLTAAAARHLAIGTMRDAQLDDDGDVIANGQLVTQRALVEAAAQDAKLLSLVAWEQGRAPSDVAGRTDNGLADLSTTELLALDAKQQARQP